MGEVTGLLALVVVLTPLRVDQQHHCAAGARAVLHSDFAKLFQVGSRKSERAQNLAPSERFTPVALRRRQYWAT
jgi:hypothetical protein